MQSVDVQRASECTRSTGEHASQPGGCVIANEVSRLPNWVLAIAAIPHLWCFIIFPHFMRLCRPFRCSLRSRRGTEYHIISSRQRLHLRCKAEVHAHSCTPSCCIRLPKVTGRVESASTA